MKNIFLLFILTISSLNCQNHIDKIGLTVEGYSSNVDFDIVIYSNKLVVLNARSDNYEKSFKGNTVGYGTNDKGLNIKETEIKGIYISKIKNKPFKEIIRIISNLDKEFEIKNFNNNKLHNSIGKLKVTYNDGSIKSIYDDGMDSNENLKKLYQLLDNLRLNQKWE